ncbi:O-antigen translocase [Providencia huaxiensis]|uniref:O-antigen translocase n=1 Tax=Providencia huaxiensis TaxID=2027290 RepID=UPI0032DA76CA
MNLVKTSILTLIATIIRLASGLIINKTISIFIGPTGLALIGQFQSIQGIIRTASQGGIDKGLIKYTAEYNDDSRKLFSLWSTSVKITISCSFLVSLILFNFSSYLSQKLFKNSDFSYVFIIFGITIILYALNQLLLSILNGLKEIKTFISINIIQSIYSLIITSLLIIIASLDGALIAMVTNQSIIFIVILFKLKNHNKIKIINFTLPLNKKIAKNLLNYSIISIVSIISMPTAMIIIRNYVGENISWDAAGYWQAITYISSMYLLVITTALSTYYLPRLSEIKNPKELKKEIINGYSLLIPLLICISLTIFFMKDFIVWLLFSKEFYPMLELFKWQLIGDIIKISSWLLSYLMLAKAMSRYLIFSEILFTLSYILLSVWFSNIFGLIGLTYAFALNYFAYFSYMIIVVYFKIFNTKTKHIDTSET